MEIEDTDDDESLEADLDVRRRLPADAAFLLPVPLLLVVLPVGE